MASKDLRPYFLWQSTNEHVHRRFVLEDELNGPSPDSIAWETVDMIYPATDLMSICISDANIIYAVAIPYSNIINNEHQIILHSLDIERREFHTTRLRSIVRDSPPLVLTRFANNQTTASRVQHRQLFHCLHSLQEDQCLRHCDSRESPSDPLLLGRRRRRTQLHPAH
jgi:hypothetical protein